MKNKVNWLIHVVPSEKDGSLCNAHTHGMEQYNHLDFQVVLNFPSEHIGYLLNALGIRVQNGETFKAGDMVSDIYEDCQIRLDEFEEMDRKVLRLIIPDKNYLFPEDPNCEEEYKKQLLETSNF